MSEKQYLIRSLIDKFNVYFGFINEWQKRNLTWSNLSIIFRLPITKVIGFVPIAGYIIIWSEQLNSFFKYPLLNDYLILNLNSRLYLIYFGGISILIFCIVFFIVCPKVIRININSDGLIGDLVRDGNSIRVEDFLSKVKKLLYSKAFEDHDKVNKEYFNFVDTGNSTAPKNLSMNISEGKVWTALTRTDSVERRSLLRLAFYYLRHHQFKRLKIMSLCWFFLIIGIIAVILPSIDVFFAVMKTFVE